MRHRERLYTSVLFVGAPLLTPAFPGTLRIPTPNRPSVLFCSAQPWSALISQSSSHALQHHIHVLCQVPTGQRASTCRGKSPRGNRQVPGSWTHEAPMLWTGSVPPVCPIFFARRTFATDASPQPLSSVSRTLLDCDHPFCGTTPDCSSSQCARDRLNPLGIGAASCPDAVCRRSSPLVVHPAPQRGVHIECDSPSAGDGPPTFPTVATLGRHLCCAGTPPSSWLTFLAVK